MWTLKVNSTEKTLADWGVCADFSIEQVSRGKSSCTLRTVERFDPGGLQFSFFDKATIYRTDRTIAFQGYFDDGKRVVNGGTENVEYVIYDVWWLFEFLQFKMTLRQIVGYTGGDPTKPILQTILSSEVWLGEFLNGLRQGIGLQLTEIINWVNECYNPTRRGATSGIDPSQDVVQVGTIDPEGYFPVTRMNTVFCSEAMQATLRLNPDTVIQIDYDTVPPTMNVRTLSKFSGGVFVDYTNLPEVVLAISEEQEKAVQIQPQRKRQLVGVIIYYKSTRTIDDLTSMVLYVDKYPPSITDYTPDISSHVIELEGAKLTNLKAEVTVVPFAGSVNGDEAAQKAWWQAHDKSLKDDKVQLGATLVKPGSFKVIDKNGNPIDLGVFVNELLTPLPTWTGEQSVAATVVADLVFKKHTDASHAVLDRDKNAHATRHNLKLTTAVTKLYTVVAHAEPAEPVPTGVAESVYRSSNALQHAGRVTLVGAQARQDVTVGVRLKLVGPHTTFENLMVQSVTTRPHYGTLDVDCGPASVLDAPNLIELARASRFRLIYNIPSGRADGSGPSAGGDVDTGGSAPEQNTAHGVGGETATSVTFPR